MMTLTLLAAAQAVADTMAGVNPVLTPVASGEPQMNLWDMACKGGWIMIVLALMSVIAFYIFFERAELSARLERMILCLWTVSVIISNREKLNRLSIIAALRTLLLHV